MVVLYFLVLICVINFYEYNGRGGTLDVLLNCNRVLGLPDFKNWLYFDELPEAKDNSLWLKDFVPIGIEAVVPSLDETGLDLLSVYLSIISQYLL